MLQGFGALRELIPHKDRMDKAALLMQGVEYIKQMQVGIRLVDRSTMTGTALRQFDWHHSLLKQHLEACCSVSLCTLSRRYCSPEDMYCRA